MRSYALFLVFLLGVAAGEYMADRMTVLACRNEHRSQLSGNDSIVCLVEEKDAK